MLSSAVNSERTTQVNIEIMCEFVKLRQMLASSTTLSRRFDEFESKFDRQFRVVSDAIRKLMPTPVPDRQQTGFRTRPVKKEILSQIPNSHSAEFWARTRIEPLCSRARLANKLS